MPIHFLQRTNPFIAKKLKEYTIGFAIKESSLIQAFNWEPHLARVDRWFLDKISSDIPILVYGQDLHSCCCNSTLMIKAGIEETSDPQSGGIVERNDSGVFTGILREDAMALTESVRQKMTTDGWKNAILQAQDYLLSLGITAVGEVMSKELVAAYNGLYSENKLILDVDGWLRIEEWNGTSKPDIRFDRYKLDTLKVFLDGSLGSQTAAMSEPYLNLPDQTVDLMFSDSELTDMLTAAVEKNWRLALHAIGDRAVAQSCRILQQLPTLKSGPHRIEHLQLLPYVSESGGYQENIDAAVRLVRDSRAVASIQPVHLIDDQRWLVKRIRTELVRKAFIWRSLYDAGVPIAIGSDWPVASSDPLLNLHVSINRSKYNDTPDQKISPNEALTPYSAIRAITYGHAFAIGEENSRGAITPGQKADITVISGVAEDLMDWSNAKVEMTICNGEVVYNNN